MVPPPKITTKEEIISIIRGAYRQMTPGRNRIEVSLQDPLVEVAGEAQQQQQQTKVVVNVVRVVRQQQQKIYIGEKMIIVHHCAAADRIFVRYTRAAEEIMGVTEVVSMMKSREHQDATHTSAAARHRQDVNNDNKY